VKRIRDLPPKASKHADTSHNPREQANAAAAPVERLRSAAVRLGADQTAEARMILLVNLLIFAGIVLITLGLAVLFMKLRRRFSYFN
jgi:hypothetical protein